MPASNPRGTALGPLLMLGLLLTVPYLALNLGEALTPTGSAITWKIPDLGANILQGRVSWPFASSFIAVGLFIAMVFAAAVL
ncbi:MAG: hypothetical protein ABWX89_04145, partial [Paeniglutamicibacter terrestris]